MRIERLGTRAMFVITESRLEDQMFPDGDADQGVTVGMEIDRFLKRTFGAYECARRISDGYIFEEYSWRTDSWEKSEDERCEEREFRFNIRSDARETALPQLLEFLASLCFGDQGIRLEVGDETMLVYAS